MGFQIELERKARLLIRMKSEAEKCLAQSKRIKDEQIKSESQMMTKVGLILLLSILLVC